MLIFFRSIKFLNFWHITLAIYSFLTFLGMLLKWLSYRLWAHNIQWEEMRADCDVVSKEFLHLSYWFVLISLSQILDILLTYYITEICSKKIQAMWTLNQTITAQHYQQIVLRAQLHKWSRESRFEADLLLVLDNWNGGNYVGKKPRSSGTITREAYGAQNQAKIGLSSNNFCSQPIQNGLNSHLTMIVMNHIKISLPAAYLQIENFYLNMDQ